MTSTHKVRSMARKLLLAALALLALGATAAAQTFPSRTITLVSPYAAGGPADLLAETGIPLLHASPEVGENLQDHLQIRLIYRCTKPITTNDQLRSLMGRARIGLQWLISRSGPLAVGINQGGIFARALPESRRPDVQFHCATLSADMADCVGTFPAFRFIYVGLYRKLHQGLNLLTGAQGKFERCPVDPFHNIQLAVMKVVRPFGCMHLKTKIRKFE